MRQYFRFFDDVSDPLFFYIEVDKHIITIKAFMHVFQEGVDVESSNLNFITDYDTSLTTFLKRHSTIIEPEHIQDVISGDIFNIDSTKNLWFKYFGSSQILRGEQNGIEFINLSTSFFDRNFGKNVGYNKIFFKEWTDCSMWSFDFNFEGMNWFTPRNLFYETINNKANFNRSESYQSYVKAPMLVKLENENTIFTTGEVRKRILGMFLFDKDDYFTNASYYVKVNRELGLILNMEGEDISQNTWKYSYPIIKNYNELPIPKFNIDMIVYENDIETFPEHELFPNELATFNVVLYDDETYILDENNQDKIMLNDFDSNIVLENTTDLFIQNSEDERERISDKYIVKKDIKIYIQSDCGYLNKKQIELKNGVGKFTFRALDLNEGDEVTIKLGFKVFTNVAEYKIKIVDVKSNLY